MKQMLRELMKEAFDYAMMKEALAEEIASRIDYSELAEIVVDNHHEEIFRDLDELIEDALLMF